MRTQPRPRNGEATIATIWARYIPLCNQSHLISRGPLRCRQVLVLLLSAWSHLSCEHVDVVIHGLKAYGGCLQGFCYSFDSLV